ncbi:2987_t:CDS:2 [Ambispora leptoticha]|uniref:2987_t:CDS:1 n=1 Tax=Ambispora leptoticha TaxID=144679 RepID=A0A9N9B1G9_9GLOM|nr:2987_t:CDS:2 [Ambispora leptoticha]
MNRPEGTSRPIGGGFQIRPCCGCISLKRAVVIISLLRLAGAIYKVITDFSTYNKSDQASKNFWEYVGHWILVDAILEIIVALGSLYGVIVVITRRKIKLLNYYVIIAWIILAITIALGIASIIAVVALKQHFLDYCDNGGTYTLDDCNSVYNILLPSTIISAIIGIIVTKFAYIKRSDTWAAGTSSNLKIL